MHFTNRIYLNEQVDMQKLGNLVLSFFKEEGFITQRINLDHTQIIQAKKGGIMRALLSTNKAFTIIVKGDPNNIDVIMGIREWIEGENQRKKYKNGYGTDESVQRIVHLMIFTWETGLSFLSVFVFPMASTTGIPSITFPNTGCFPSR